jgi:hypothetical protein
VPADRLERFSALDLPIDVPGLLGQIGAPPETAAG